MKRYMVCKIIGDGSELNPYRPAVADVIDPATGMRAFNSINEIAIHPEDYPVTGLRGKPVHNWCLVRTQGTKYGLLTNNPDIDLLPDVALDMEISAMHVPTKNKMAASIQARRVSLALLDNASGYRDVIDRLGRLHRADFNSDTFDLPE